MFEMLVVLGNGNCNSSFFLGHILSKDILCIPPFTSYTTPSPFAATPEGISLLMWCHTVYVSKFAIKSSVVPLIFFLCSLNPTLTLTPPTNNALLACEPCAYPIYELDVLWCFSMHECKASKAMQFYSWRSVMSAGSFLEGSWSFCW